MDPIQSSRSGLAKCGSDKLVDAEADHCVYGKQSQRHSVRAVGAVAGGIRVADPEENPSDHEQHDDDWNGAHL